MKKKFLLYACCLPVRGYKRSIIVDTQRQCVYFIPNTMFFVLKELRMKDIDLIKEEYSNPEMIDKYIAFLLSKELGYFSDDSDCFPNIAFGYESPYLITNAIVVINEQSKHNYNKIFLSLEEVSCQAIELRILYDIPPKKIKEILDTLNSLHLSFYSITLILPYSHNFDRKIKDIVSCYPLITHIFMYQSPLQSERIVNQTTIRQIIDKQIECGNVSPKYFSPNLKMFIESQSRNSCLNQKVCIDYDGSIKNCPAMKRIYGYLSTDKLIDIVRSSDFTSVWTITKDSIMVCKDCEFRYICLDCRVFTSNKNNIYSHPLKCKYNPYIAKWEKDDGYTPIEYINR